MKTRSEKKYADLVISMIMNSNQSLAEKEKSVKNFFINHSYYYENLCYNTYYLTMLPGTNVLTIDEQGISHVNLKDRNPEMRYYDILILNEFSPYCGDVIMHIDVALNHLYDLVRAEKTVDNHTAS